MSRCGICGAKRFNCDCTKGDRKAAELEEELTETLLETDRLMELVKELLRQEIIERQKNETD